MKPTLLKSIVLVCLLAAQAFAIVSAAESLKGTLRYGEYGRPATLDPITSSDGVSLRAVELMFDGLVSIAEHQEIIPALAERWTVSNDGAVYTFQLRKDVTWHASAGETLKRFSADDVVFTYRLMANPKTQGSLKARVALIKEVKKIDDATVQFTLSQPSSNALALFSLKIVPKHKIARDFLTRDDSFVQHPIGTGPFMLAGSPADREIVFVANPHYFRGAPKLARVILKPFSDQNILQQAFKFNSVDMIASVAPRDLQELQANPRIHLAPYNTLSYSFLGFNLRNPILADKNVRRALSLAVNRPEILRSFFNNQGLLISGPFPPGSWAYNLDVQPLTFAPDEAAGLLKKAGFSAGSDGILARAGQRLHLRLRAPIAKENESTKRVVLAYQNYLKKIGVEIKIDFLELQAWNDAVFNRNNFDIMFGSWSFDDAADISTLFHSADIGPWKNNFGAYRNEKVDKLINEAKAAIDLNQRRAIYQQLHQLLAEDAPYTFLWTLTDYAAYTDRIHDVKIHPFRFFADVHTWDAIEKNDANKP